MTCSREGCGLDFAPRAPHQRFCSTRCRQLDHERNRPELKAARDSRYIHNTGWYVRYRQRLGRRIRQRLEEV